MCEAGITRICVSQIVELTLVYKTNKINYSSLGLSLECKMKYKCNQPHFIYVWLIIHKDNMSNSQRQYVRKYTNLFNKEDRQQQQRLSAK